MRPPRHVELEAEFVRTIRWVLSNKDVICERVHHILTSTVGVLTSYVVRLNFDLLARGLHLQHNPVPQLFAPLSTSDCIYVSSSTSPENFGHVRIRGDFLCWREGPFITEREPPYFCAGVIPTLILFIIQSILSLFLWSVCALTRTASTCP